MAAHTWHMPVSQTLRCTPELSRRRLLGLTAALALPTMVSCASGVRVSSHVSSSSYPFSLGVASGSPTHEAVVLWTRWTGQPLARADDAVSVHWELAHDERFERIVQRGVAQAVPQLGHSVHVELHGLAPDRWYFYRFFAGDAISPVGRTRTFPAPGQAAQALRLAYASCQKWEDGYFSAYPHMLQEDLDLVLFLGDYVYEYPGTSSRIRQPNATPSGGWLLTLEDYRARYALYRSDPALQAMHAACPWLMTWDDHEVQNDYAGVVPGHSGEPVADFAARRAAAYQAYYEFMPLPAAVLRQALGGLASGAEMRLYAQLRFGDLAQFYLLDTRQYRDAQACTPGGRTGSATLDPRACPAWNDPRRSLLGAAQEAWLAQAFRDSHAAATVWNVVGQQTLLGQRDFKAGAGQLLWNDGWDGYASARQRLLAAVQQSRLANPVFLGGDVHENWVGHIKADYQRPDSPHLGVEFCGTSLTSRAGDPARVPGVLAENPHFIFGDARRRGYGVVDFAPARLSVQLRVVDSVAHAQSGIETLARFGVEAGHPEVFFD